MTLVAGCYERFLFGYTYSIDKSESQSNCLSRSFTHAAHKGVVKSLSSAGQYVASGGADDLIHLYDLLSDSDLGFLMNPGQGSISALQFFTPSGAYNPTHLLAGCSDGTISVWIAGGGWQCMRSLRGHKGEVTSITVHPSGCLALTTSRDGTLKLWDLVKGRVTFSTKMEGNAEPESVLFSPSGTQYALQTGSTVTIKPVDSTSNIPVVKLMHSRKVLSMCFGSSGDGVLITGAEDGALSVWNTRSEQVLLRIPRAHKTRIKDLVIPYSPLDIKEEEIPDVLATASSDGVIKLWKLRNAVSEAKIQREREVPELEDGGEKYCIGQAETKARLTTLCAVDPNNVMEGGIRKAAVLKKKAAKQNEGKTKKKVNQTEEQDRPASKKQLVQHKGSANKKSADTVRGGGSTKNEREKDGKVQRDGTVSFMDEEDARNRQKKQKKVQINAKRAAETRAAQQKRAKQVPGSRSYKDA